ncbi:DUF4129 domain-containing protein [Deinococcus aquiradiocola]|nr:DUF4129 domain-containing protein [Deinococcus aquiradiocola]
MTAVLSGARGSWVSWLPVLLPFVALGALPWTVCLALSVALAVSRVNEDAEALGGALVLLAATAATLPVLFGTSPDRLPRAGEWFVAGALLGGAALWSMRRMAVGERRALLPGLLVLLVWPSVPGLLAFVLSALGMGGGRGSVTRSLWPARRVTGPVLVLLAVVGVAGALLAGVLPGPPPALSAGSTVRLPPAPAGARTQAAPQERAPAPITRAARSGGAARRPMPEELPLLRALVPVSGLLAAVCLVLLTQRARVKRGGRRSTWLDAAALLGLLGALLMVGVYGAGTRSGTLAAPPGAQAGQDPAGRAHTREQASAGQDGAARLNPAVLLMNVGIVASAVFLAAATLYLLHDAHLNRASRSSAVPDGMPAGGSAPPLPPLHRVRLAWRALEDALGEVGLPRLPSETPHEYARRVTVRHPDLSGPLSTLAALYAPVRYGGQLSERDAGTAEEAVSAVRHALP